MEIRVTMYGRDKGGGDLALSSDILLYADGPAQSVYRQGRYEDAVGIRLTPLGRAAIDHLCRDLDDVMVVLLHADNCIALRPQQRPAVVYQRLCSRVLSATSGELPLYVGLERRLLEPVTVVVAGSQTAKAVLPS